MAHNGPTEEPKMAPWWPKMAQDDPDWSMMARIAHDGIKWPEKAWNGSKMAKSPPPPKGEGPQYGPQNGPTFPQNGPILARYAQHYPKMAA